MTEASFLQPSQSPRLHIAVQPNADFTPNGTVSRKRPAFSLALQTSNRLGRVNNSMFATQTKQIYAGGNKTSKSSYGNTSVHTALTTALTRSQMSTTMMLRQQAMEQANRPEHRYNPQTDIQKYIPRQP